MKKTDKIKILDILIKTLYKYFYICNCYNREIEMKDNKFINHKLIKFEELDIFIKYITTLTGGHSAWHIQTITLNSNKSIRYDDPIYIKAKIILLKMFKNDLIISTKSDPLTMDKYTEEFLINKLKNIK